jgi:hypothetical protein
MMMKEKIAALAASPLVHSDVRVVTLAQVDELHARPAGTAKRNFNANKKRFVEGRDFFALQPDEIRTAGFAAGVAREHGGGGAERMILLTERGYPLLVKSLRDDLSWQVQGELIDGYFRHRELGAEVQKIAEALIAKAVEAVRAPLVAEIEALRFQLGESWRITERTAGVLAGELARRGHQIRTQERAQHHLDMGQRLLVPDARPIETVKRAPRRSRNPLPRPTREQIAALLNAWVVWFGRGPVTVREAIDDAVESADDGDARLADALRPFGEKPNVVGQVLAKVAGEIVNGETFERCGLATRSRATLWRVVQVAKVEPVNRVVGANGASGKNGGAS